MMVIAISHRLVVVALEALFTLGAGGLVPVAVPVAQAAVPAGILAGPQDPRGHSHPESSSRRQSIEHA